MRLAIHDFGGYPFSAQLARTLASRGHEVLYLCRSGFRLPRAEIERRPDDPSSLEFRGIGLGEPYRVRASVLRLMQERRYGRRLAAEIKAWVPDVVISANCPLDAQAAALTSAHRVGAAFVFWVQDIYAHAVGRLLARRVPLVGPIVGARFARLERRLLQASDAAVLITADFLKVMRAWSVPEDRLTVIENWAPLDEIMPGPKVNEWSVAHGLADRPVLLYAGTLGRKHDPAILIHLANEVPEADVVVVSEGTGTDQLRGRALPRNVALLPLQLASRVPDVLATAEILIALLERDAREFSVPSKVLTYFAAGRPILAAMPRANLASRIIMEAEAGVVIDPSDPRALVDSARALLRDSPRASQLGRNGRLYAERAFGIDGKADRFETVFREAAERRSSRMAEDVDTGQAARGSRTRERR